MRLTTIGTGTVAPSRARVCAGHLVEAGATRILLDCGSGVHHRLASLPLDWVDLTHLAITHFHADHISDVALLLQAFRYGTLPPRSAPFVVIGPPGITSLLDRMASLYGSWVSDPGFPLEIREVSLDIALSLPDGVTLSSRKVPHTEESVAYSLSRGSRRLVYTGDMAYDEDLARWAAGCDVLLMECSLPSSMAVASHLTPEQCGQLAAIASPGVLVLTHFYPPVDGTDIRGSVARAFRGPVALARDGWHIEIGESSCSS